MGASGASNSTAVVTRDLQWRGLECFDLESDPEERRNLLLDDAACPEAARTLAAHYRDFSEVADAAPAPG